MMIEYIVYVFALFLLVFAFFRPLRVATMRLFGRKSKEKIVSEAEARQIDLEGKGRVMKFLGNDKVSVDMFPPPKSKPGETPPNIGDVVKSIDVNAKATIPFQLTRIKRKKRVVISRGKFKKGQIWIRNKIKGEPGFRDHYADLSQLAWVPYTSRSGKEYFKQELILDIFYCEAINPETGNCEWSQDVEDMIVDSKIDQEVEVAQGPLPFKITRTVAIAMIASAVFLSFFGLSLNSIFNFVPNVVIHWIPG